MVVPAADAMRESSVVSSETIGAEEATALGNFQATRTARTKQRWKRTSTPR